MRKIDAIANEKFDGDIRRTLEYLLYEADGPFTPYIDELTQEEAQMVMQFVEKDAIKHYGSEEALYSEFKKQKILAQLGLEEEEVRKTAVNPFRKPLVQSLLCLLAGILLSVLLALAGKHWGFPEIAAGIGSTAIGLGSLSVARSLINFFKFRKVKKQIDRESVN